MAALAQLADVWMSYRPPKESVGIADCTGARQFSRGCGVSAAHTSKKRFGGERFVAVAPNDDWPCCRDGRSRQDCATAPERNSPAAAPADALDHACGQGARASASIDVGGTHRVNPYPPAFRICASRRGKGASASISHIGDKAERNDPFSNNSQPRAGDLIRKPMRDCGRGGRMHLRDASEGKAPDCEVQREIPLRRGWRQSSAPAAPVANWCQPALRYQLHAARKANSSATITDSLLERDRLVDAVSATTAAIVVPTREQRVI